MLSIIIPYHNEGQDFIETTIKEIRDTIDVAYEIIVVNDFSDKPLNPIEGVTIIHHHSNLGVGAAFDTGVSYASFDNLFIMGCDIRFQPNGWASKMIEEVNKHPKAITCTAVAMLREDNHSFQGRKYSCVGATMVLYHDNLTDVKKKDGFKGLLEAKWLPLTQDTNKDSKPIPCVLGAAYGLKKAWYEYIDGFWGHKLWGTLEPLISVKSWMFGGECRVAPRVRVGHIFKEKGTHGTPMRHLMYNKMLLSNLVVEEPDRLLKFVGESQAVSNGRVIFNSMKDEILKRREAYKAKTVMGFKDFCDKWDIDTRNLYTVEDRVPTVLLYPDKLRGNRLKFALDALGYNYHNDPTKPYDVALYWSYHQVRRELDDTSATLPLLNKGCWDISKEKVNKVFDNVNVNPETYHGVAVRKTNHQGAHNGELTVCPQPQKPGWVYQKFIDTKENNHYLCYRVFYAGQVDFVVKQWETDMFKLSHAKVEMVDKRELMTEEQERWLCDKMVEFGCDFGEVDVLKDKDGEIYVIDLNNVAGNSHIMWELVRVPYVEEVKQFIKKCQQA
jgi:glycosyltransferase involved in cell wall biosynthesis